jgi:predicted Zn-dependent protease
MRILTSFTLALSFLFVTQACVEKKNVSPEESCHFQQNSYLQRVSWSQTPINMYADSTVTPAQLEAYQEAMDIWNEEFRRDFGGKDIFVFAGTLSGYVGNQMDGKNVLSLAGDWAGLSEDQANTFTSWYDTSIVDADIILNGSKNFATSDTVASNELDTVALLVHELGHVLGLKHIDDSGYSVMNASLSLGNTHRREIGAVEIDALRCEY